MLLLFRRTRLLGVFVLLPVLANILLMDVFYQIGDSVVVHASIMMLGVLYVPLLLIAMPVFKGIILPATGSGSLMLTGLIGKDSMNIIMQKAF